VPNKGLFFSLDGLDGTGKSTQCRLLAQWLTGQSYPVTQCVDPGGTAVGQQLRALLLDQKQTLGLTCEMFLFMASRAQLTREIIQPALEAGQIVLSDRYLLANVVYQGHAGGLDVEQLWNIGNLATEGIEPDLTLVLDLPVATALTRRNRQADRLESRDLTFHQKVRDGFLHEAQRRPDKIKVIDASGDIDDIQREIQTQIVPFLPGK
jgi:dTMP kinase